MIFELQDGKLSRLRQRACRAIVAEQNMLAAVSMTRNVCLVVLLYMVFPPVLILLFVLLVNVFCV